MYEHLATIFGGPPNVRHFRLYSEWAKHDWGIILTGNVQVSSDHLTLGRDIILPRDLAMAKDDDLEPFRRLAHTIHGTTPSGPDGRATLAIMQLSHAGRQSINVIGGRRILQPPIAPSQIRMGSSTCKTSLVEGLMNKILFQTPKVMKEEDILHVIDRFVDGSVFAHKAGFDGVQLHVAHGCMFFVCFPRKNLTAFSDLLSLFLSPTTNKRTDSYSCDKSLDLIQTIIDRIRAQTPKDFVISIKLNAADYTSGSTESNLTTLEQRALQHLMTIASWATVDIIEVSGGDYETPLFMTSERSQCRSPRQTFFTRFSHQAVKALSSVSDSSVTSTRPMILLTGGFRTPAMLSAALASKHADLLGIGRAAVRSPDIPTILMAQPATQSDSAAENHASFEPEPDLDAIRLYPPASWLWNILSRMKLAGAGADMAWHTLAMRDIAMLPLIEGDKKPIVPKLNYTLGALYCVLMMFLWRLPASN